MGKNKSNALIAGEKVEMEAAALEIDSSEEIIRQRVRENLKYLEELGISKDLLEFARREYKLWVDDPKQRYYRKRSSTNQNAGREYTGRIASDDQKIAALNRAEELQIDLKSRRASFIKPMVRSHVSGGFWLGLPTKFCKENLPPSELRMVLEDKKGKEHDVLYLGRKNGLSGGWRGFAIDHNLEDGDVLIFELSPPERFKVHIVKAIEGTDENDMNSANVHIVKAIEGTDENDMNSANVIVKAKKSTKPKKEDCPVLKRKRGRPPKTGSGKEGRETKLGRK